MLRLRLHPLSEGELARDDPAIADLDPETRAVVAAIWSERAESELTAARGMIAVAAAVLDRAPGSEDAWLATRAVSDEVRHASICTEVASRYAGAESRWPTIRRSTRAHDDPIHRAPEVVRPLLGVLATCAVNETIATAFLEHCLAHVEVPLVHAALRALLADEIDHARVGWAVLASLDGNERTAVKPHVEPVLVACEAAWRKRIASLPARDLSAHGCPSPSTIADVVRDAVRDLVHPGLARAGLSP